MRRTFLLGILLSVCLFVAPEHIHAEKISQFDTSIKISSDGTLRISERILYDFDTSQRHGIFRNIPYITSNSEGKKFKMELSDFSVTDQSGAPYAFSTSSENFEKKLIIGEKSRLITGEHGYIIEYTVKGGLRYFSDHDELYWNTTGNNWNYPIASASADIELPVQIPVSDIKISCYTGISGRTEQQCNTAYAQGKATVTTQNPLTVHEGLTVVVGFPKGIVSVLEPIPYVPFWDTFVGKACILLFILAGAYWYIILPVSIAVKWWNNGRDPHAVTGEVSAWFTPPKTQSGRELTPGETGTLVDEVVHMRDISATLIHMAQRGYIKIIEAARGDFTLERLPHTLDDVAVQPFEKSLLSGIFPAGQTSIRLKAASIVSTAETVKNKLYDAVVTQGFFPKNPQSIRNSYILLTVIGFFTGNFPLVLSSLIFGLQMPRKTQAGSEQAAVARSLRNFLKSQERQLEFQAKNQMFFEKLLPYAVAFGVEKIWAKRFADIQMKQPDWYEGSGNGRFNSIVFVNSISHTTSSFSKAATPVSSSTGHSSGFSGGSSGGGGGGGGGGSW